MAPLKTLTVLYYKRSNKIHKTGKEDGSLDLYENGRAVLRCDGGDNNNDDDDESEEEYASKKAKWNAIRKNMNNSSGGKGVVYTGVHRDIVKRCSDISEDDVLLLGPWECQVVSIGDKKPIATSTTAPLAARTNLNGLTQKKMGLGGVKRSLGGTGGLGSKIPIGAKRIKGCASAAASAPFKAVGIIRKKTPDSAVTEDSDDSSDEEEVKQPPARLVKRGPLKSVKSTLPISGVKKVNNSSVKPNTNRTSLKAITPNNSLSTDIHLPPSIQKVLRPHQREGVSFLWKCVTGSQEGIQRVYRQEHGDGEVPRGAVLADEMGLGKTLMTISTIYALHYKTRDSFIIVCPSSLVSNWSKEFDKWLGKASNPKRNTVRNGSEEGLRHLKSFVVSKHPEVLILSYELFRVHVGILCKAHKIGMLVVDEGHRLKNTAGSRTLEALNSLRGVGARILITGTPIQNNLGEFYNIANFALPGILGELNTFRRLYERPMSAANKKNATREEKQRGGVQSKALDEITKTFVLRRLQKDVLKSLLPPRMELLLFCRPADKQCELYRDISDRAAKLIGSLGGHGENPLTLLTALRKLCTHPLLLEKDGLLADNSTTLSGKMMVLEELIDSIREHNPTDKVVIVSNFTSALSVIESSILRKKNLPFVRLDGSVELSARQPMVDSFNNGSVSHSFAFLLSSKAGGCGLNLIGANRLIMVDADWNPATDQQAMGRVYRQGQKKPCFIYRMFTTGTVEEVIFQRQTQKGNLAQLANDGGKSKSSSSSFTPEELRDCFTLKQGCKCDTKDKLGKRWNDYSGAITLQNQGCADEPLLAICENLVDTLSFVRVADDVPTAEEMDSLEKDSSYAVDLLCSDDEHSASSSTDEEEFVG